MLEGPEEAGVLDYEACPQTPRVRAARALGWRAHLRLPVAVAGRCEASLLLFSQQAPDLSPGFIEICLGVRTHMAGRLQQGRATAELRASEARFRSLFESTELGLAVLDLGGRMLEANPALASMLGYSTEELIGRRFADFSLSDEEATHQAMFGALVAGQRRRFDLVHNYRRKDGATTTVHMVISLVRDLDGRPTHAVGMALDISLHTRLRRLAGESSWRERRRIAQVLHDDLAQILTGTTLGSEALARRLRRVGSDQADAALELAASMIAARGALRTLARDLEPVSAQTGGLEGALESLAERRSASGPPVCSFSSAGDVSLPDYAADRLFRVAEDTIKDATRQGATQISIRLGRRASGVQLLVEHDGTLDLAQGEAQRLRWEADLAGASLEVSPREAEAVTLRCTVPTWALESH